MNEKSQKHILSNSSQTSEWFVHRHRQVFGVSGVAMQESHVVVTSPYTKWPYDARAKPLSERQVHKFLLSSLGQLQLVDFHKKL
jgi:hypothetical protein